MNNDILGHIYIIYSQVIALEKVGSFFLAYFILIKLFINIKFKILQGLLIQAHYFLLCIAGAFMTTSTKSGPGAFVD